MKIAFCVSGIPRSGVGPSETHNQDFLRNAKSHHRAFPDADYFYATWTEYATKVNDLFPNHNTVAFPEPDVNYHPFYDVPEQYLWSDRLRKVVAKYKLVKDARQQRYQHQTKQILAHAYLINHFNLKQSYDVIVRSRYDTFISHAADFTDICNEVSCDPKAVGFALLRGNEFNVLKPITSGDNYDRFLFDSLIVHSSKVFDPDHVIQLHNQKKLLPCEFGWFQTMSMECGENHKCFSGWANADRSVPSKYFK